MTAGNGKDNIDLGNGNDVVTAGNGNDSVNLGNGNDAVTAGNGNDSINAAIPALRFGYSAPSTSAYHALKFARSSFIAPIVAPPAQERASAATAYA